MVQVCDVRIPAFVLRCLLLFEQMGFSSALVPLVTAGWMDGGKLTSPPVHIMETGWDILGFWVSRMMMLTTA